MPKVSLYVPDALYEKLHLIPPSETMSGIFNVALNDRLSAIAGCEHVRTICAQCGKDMRTHCAHCGEKVDGEKDGNNAGTGESSESDNMRTL